MPCYGALSSTNSSYRENFYLFFYSQRTHLPLIHLSPLQTALIELEPLRAFSPSRAFVFIQQDKNIGFCHNGSLMLIAFKVLF